MRETVMNNNPGIITSELNNLYNKSSELFFTFINSVIGTTQKCNMVFSANSKCSDSKSKKSINVPHIFNKKYDLFIIEGSDKTNDIKYLRDCITFLTEQADIYPQIVICVSAEHFQEVSNNVNQIIKKIKRPSDEYFIKVMDAYYILYHLSEYKHNFDITSNDDTLYATAKEIVIRDKKPTISYLQRKLEIGYNKSAAFIERMEFEGIISAPDENNKRHLL